MERSIVALGLHRGYTHRHMHTGTSLAMTGIFWWLAICYWDSAMQDRRNWCVICELLKWVVFWWCGFAGSHSSAGQIAWQGTPSYDQRCTLHSCEAAKSAVSVRTVYVIAEAGNTLIGSSCSCGRHTLYHAFAKCWMESHKPHVKTTFM